MNNKECQKLYNKYKELSKIDNEVSDWIFYEYKDCVELSEKEIKDFILKEIENRIPELHEIFEKDEKLKNYYLKHGR